MDKWFKKHLNRSRSIIYYSIPTWFKRYLHHPVLWDFKQGSVARGVAAGLFIAMIPIMPFQTLLIILLAIIIRGNIAVAFAISWVSNPLTILPLAYFTYQIGNWILGTNNQPMPPINLDWHFTFENWNAFSKWILQFGKAFFVGLPIIALGSALLGYLIVIILWHIVSYFRKKA